MKYFVPMQKKKIPFLKERSCNWNDAFDAESLTSFKAGEPNWRVRMFEATKHPNGDYRHPFIFCFAHAITDGHSVMTIYKSFIGYLEGLIKNEVIHVTSTPTCPPLLDVINERIKIPTLRRFVNRLSFKINELREGSSSLNLTSAVVEKLKTGHAPCSGVWPLNLTRETSQKIFKKSKEMGVTVNSFCTVVGTLAMRDLLAKIDLIPNKDCAIDLMTIYMASTRLIAVPNISDELVGNLPIMTKTKVPISDGSSIAVFWKTVKQFDAEIIRQKKSGRMFDMYFSWIDTLNAVTPEAFCDRVYSNPGSYQQLLAFSNFGRHELTPPSSERIIKFAKTYPGVSEYTNGPALFVHLLVTVDGLLNWSINHHKNRFSDDILADYEKSMKTLLDSVI
ncbi:uncharacterized protein LOC141900035 [Tubulanus polymorphus]|uniref:uncharacterized protein LOC141900035 n=1 Tax=Tubulanus polymorphus TaxID=672921 RepID=UPI003DA59F4F